MTKAVALAIFSATKVVSVGRGLGTFVPFSYLTDMSGVRVREGAIQPDLGTDDSEEYCRYLSI